MEYRIITHETLKKQSTPEVESSQKKKKTEKEKGWLIYSFYHKPFLSSVTTSGSSVAIIIATDTENDPMVFSLDFSVQDVLHIDNTGNLTLQKKLDREVSWKMTITLPKMKQSAQEIGKWPCTNEKHRKNIIWRQRSSVAIQLPLILIKRQSCTAA